MARILRGNAVAALENIALWHERDITHSSVERVIFPDSTILAHYMLVTLRKVIENLQVYKERMLSNLEISRGMVFSQGLLLRLVEKGYTREEGYAMVQEAARRVWDDAHLTLRESVLGDSEIRKVLSTAEIQQVFQFQYHLKNVSKIFKRLGL